MGRLEVADLGLLPMAAEIHCVSRTDALIVGGTSNWAAWALIAALEATEGGDATISVLEPHGFVECLERMLAAGAVDGVSGEPALSVDGLSSETHCQMLGAISTAVSFGPR
jgi:hypothetical protein